MAYALLGTKNEWVQGTSCIQPSLFLISYRLQENLRETYYRFKASIFTKYPYSPLRSAYSAIRIKRLKTLNFFHTATINEKYFNNR
ncbi:hypothetical protein CGZ75_20690 [Paenibacillus herberti]|uniref:Uncharacterized protein n=1 Tax=Paenibacillus herberti TaxID=1619309 RepID=A0A229NUG9_9BACL|nr:hypothetical protein CGZ75_20690 [Paenibacillus herberti]